MITVFCAECGGEIKRYASEIARKGIKKSFCNKVCKSLNMWKYKDHAETTRAMNARWKEKRKIDPVYRAKRLQYDKEQYEKNKLNPEYMARRRAYFRARRARIKAQKKLSTTILSK